MKEFIDMLFSPNPPMYIVSAVSTIFVTGAFQLGFWLGSRQKKSEMTAREGFDLAAKVYGKYTHTCTPVITYEQALKETLSRAAKCGKGGSHG